MYYRPFGCRGLLKEEENKAHIKNSNLGTPLLLSLRSSGGQSPRPGLLSARVRCTTGRLSYCYMYNGRPGSSYYALIILKALNRLPLSGGPGGLNFYRVEFAPRCAYVNRAVLVHVLGVGLVLYCANRARCFGARASFRVGCGHGHGPAARAGLVLYWHIANGACNGASGQSRNRKPESESPFSKFRGRRHRYRARGWPWGSMQAAGPRGREIRVGKCELGHSKRYVKNRFVFSELFGWVARNFLKN